MSANRPGLGRSVSFGMTVLACCTSASCLIYCIMSLIHPHGIMIDYAGFLRYAATNAVLPAYLILTYVLHAHYRVEEAVRTDIRMELFSNVSHLIIVDLVEVAIVVMVFTVMQAIGGTLAVSEAPILALLMVQLLMMNASVGAMQLLLTNCGLVWEHVTAVLTGWYAIVMWLLLPLAGEPARYLCWFWQPIVPDWHVVIMTLLLPFVGYCILMALANAAVFGRRERLEA